MRSYLLSVLMAVSSSQASLADRFLLILRGDPLACVMHAGANKDSLARTSTRKACTVSALDLNL